MKLRTFFLCALCSTSVSLTALHAQGEPTNAKEAAKQNAKPKAITPEQKEAYEKLLTTLPAEEQAWERTLSENLGGFYFPNHQKDRVAGKITAWNYLKDEPGLPRMLIIGDSISRSYTLDVRKALAGKANVHRAPANCGPTDTGLKKLDIWLGEKKWDVITFNFGIHDRATPPETYRANLVTLLARLRATGAHIYWVRTTPASEGPNKENFTAAHCESLNRIADQLMHEAGIPVIDIYSLVAPRLAEFQLPNNVHFNGKGSSAMGKEIAGKIASDLSASSSAKKGTQ
jgi:lysophospholipase L1-like esterase